jgi:hypothetical protein
MVPLEHAKWLVVAAVCMILEGPGVDALSFQRKEQEEDLLLESSGAGD